MESVRRGGKNLFLQVEAINPKITFFKNEGLVHVLPQFDIALMMELKIPCDPNKRKLFIDSTKASLEVVLLVNGNELLLALVTYSCRSERAVLSLIKTVIIIISVNFADLKVVALLRCLQSAFTKFCCFLFQWDSRATKPTLHTT